jgi:hypothetical protein
VIACGRGVGEGENDPRAADADKKKEQRRTRRLLNTSCVPLIIINEN